MKFVWQTARKDFQRYRRNPIEFAVWIGVPIFIGTIMVLATGGRSGPKPQAYVLVADQDDSFLSGLLHPGAPFVAGIAHEVEIEALAADLDGHGGAVAIGITGNDGRLVALVRPRPGGDEEEDFAALDIGRLTLARLGERVADAGGAGAGAVDEPVAEGAGQRGPGAGGPGRPGREEQKRGGGRAPRSKTHHVTLPNKPRLLPPTARSHRA